MATYYVSTTGDNTAAGTTTGTAWRHFQYACQQLYPGDTLKVLPGIYRETNILLTNSNCRSGTVGSPITVTANDTNDKPKIRNTNGPSTKVPQIEMRDLSHWTLDNLEISDTNGIGIEIKAFRSDIEGMTVSNCDFLRVNVDTPVSGHTLHFLAQGGNRARNCTVSDNYFYKCEPRMNNQGTSPGDGNECCTFEGDVRGIIKDNVFVQCLAICIDLLGWEDQTWPGYSGQPSFVIVRGNYIQGTRITNVSGSGNSIYSDKAGAYILIEENLIDETQNISGIKTNNEPWYDDSITSGPFIVRNNVVLTRQYPMMSGAVPSGSVGKVVNGMRAAHNVLIRVGTDTNYTAPIQIGRLDDGQWKNNIFLNRTTQNDRMIVNRKGVTYTGYTYAFDGNLYYATNGGDGHYTIGATSYATWALFTAAGYEANGQQGTNVTFTDEANDDYTLDTGSEGLGDAISLTLTNGTGSSSSTLIVDDAKWFTDGFGLQGGDQIYVAASTPFTAVVTGIDYANNTLYLSTEETWQDGVGVYYAYSSTADQGLTDEVRSGGAAPPVPPTPPTEPSDPTPPVVGDGTELLSNPDFDEDNLTAGTPLTWCRYSAGTATWSIDPDTGKLTVNVTATGGNTQLFQYGFEITSGNSYRLGLQVDGAAAKDIRVSCHEHDGSYTNLGLLQTVSVTTDDEQTIIDWTATGSSDNARLRIEFIEATGGNMVFSYISLQDRTNVNVVTGGTGSTTLSVAASGDDVAIGDSAYNATATTTRIGYHDSQNRWAILRFILDEAIPDGATITEATLTVRGDVSSGSGWQIQIDAEDTDDAGAITSKADYDTRAWTTANTTWAPSAWSFEFLECPQDLSSIIQELVDDNSGLANAAAIQLRLSDFAATTRYVRISQYDNSASHAATLYLAWYSDSTSGHAIGTGTMIGMTIGAEGIM